MNEKQLIRFNIAITVICGVIAAAMLAGLSAVIS